MPTPSSAAVEPYGPWFRALAEGVRSGVVILDRRAEPVYANHAALELLCAAGPTEAAASPRDLAHVRRMLPMRLTSACRANRLPVESDASVTIGEHVRRVRLECVPIEQGVGGALVFVDSRTRDSILEDSLALASRSQSLVRAEIHDLRAPLNALGLTAALLRDSLEAEERKDETVREEQIASAVVLQREVARLDRMLSSFLNRTTTSRCVRPSRLELGRLARSVGRLVRASARDRGVRVRIEIDGNETSGGVFAFGDRDRLRQALLNVVVNALEASPDGGELRLRVRDGMRPRIAVEDDGPGIPRHLRRRVFDMSFTTKREGTGIGLTVARTLVESMGGDLLIEDGTRGGAVVAIALRPADEEDRE